MLAKKNEGLKVLKDAQSVSDIKKASEILELNAKEISVNNENKAIDKNLFDKKSEKESIIERFNFIKQTQRESIEKAKGSGSGISKATSVYSSSNSNSNATTSHDTNTPVVNLQVPQNLALSIQNKIIGAKQQMSAMMSDMAKTMYENYKPPVTAFRINLMPANLGSIAILMKSNEKDNSLNISMNLSNSKTLDSFVEGESSLKDALNRTFNGSQTSFNLEFNMDENSSNQSDTSTENQQNSSKEASHSSQDILKSVEDNKNVGEDINYL